MGVRTDRGWFILRAGCSWGPHTRAEADAICESLKNRHDPCDATVVWRGPCPNDTNGDGDCGRRFCPHCGQPMPEPQPDPKPLPPYWYDPLETLPQFDPRTQPQ